MMPNHALINTTSSTPHSTEPRHGQNHPGTKSCLRLGKFWIFLIIIPHHRLDSIYRRNPHRPIGRLPKSDEPQSDLGEAGEGAFTPFPANGKSKGGASFSEIPPNYIHNRWHPNQAKNLLNQSFYRNQKSDGYHTVTTIIDLLVSN